MLEPDLLHDALAPARELAPVGRAAGLVGPNVPWPRMPMIYPGSCDGILGKTAITRRAMTHPLGTQSALQRTPLSADEKARAVGNFAPYVAG